MKSGHKRRLLEQNKPKEKTSNGLFSHWVRLLCKEKKKLKMEEVSNAAKLPHFQLYEREPGKVKADDGRRLEPSQKIGKS